MDFKQLLFKFTSLGLKLIPLLGIIAFLIFILGVGRFIRNSGQSKDADKGMLTYGVGALFVLLTIWGIISFIQNEFGLGTEVGIPQIRLK